MDGPANCYGFVILRNSKTSLFSSFSSLHMRSQFLRALSVHASLLIVCAAPGAASALDMTGMAIYGEAGSAPHGDATTHIASAGVMVPWSPSFLPSGGASSAYWDLFVAHWQAKEFGGDGHQSYTQLGAIATWRYRFDAGRSPWFGEAGLGALAMDKVYRTPAREFSTAFQFTEVFGLGRNFGSRQEHALSLRFQHISNGGIKSPNPGENTWRVRYAYRF